MKPKRYLYIFVSITLVIASIASACNEESTCDGELLYADTEWRSVHSGPMNNDYVPIDIGREFRTAWTALDGVSTLAPVSIGPDRTLYQTTGQGPGNSNLYAFDLDGNILWASDPWYDASDFDFGGFMSTAIIDDAGDLYVCDANQFWALHSDGTVKWVIDLPPAPPGAAYQDTMLVNPFITAFFQLDGSVGGITFFGDIVIVSREDGSPQAPVTNLPGGPGLSSEPPPPTFLTGAADPLAIEIMWNVFFGYYGECIDTPAVDPSTGRIFAAAAGSEPGTGSLYGIDYTPENDGDLGTIEITFEAPLGYGNTSSPALSPDGSRVHAGDAQGNMTAIDKETGEVIWSVPAGNRPASPSVGPDGRIYLVAGTGTCFNPDGTFAWEADLSDLVEEIAPENPTLGTASAEVDGIITITNEAIIYPVVIKYTLDPDQFPDLPLPQPVPLPVACVVVTVDRETGELIEGSVPYFLRDTNDGFCIPLKEGLVVANNGSYMTSSIAPLAPFGNQFLPPGLQVLEPIGGIEVLQAID